MDYNDSLFVTNNIGLSKMWTIPFKRQSLMNEVNSFHIQTQGKHRIKDDNLSTQEIQSAPLKVFISAERCDFSNPF